MRCRPTLAPVSRPVVAHGLRSPPSCAVGPVAPVPPDARRRGDLRACGQRPRHGDRRRAGDRVSARSAAPASPDCSPGRRRRRHGRLGRQRGRERSRRPQLASCATGGGGAPLTGGFVMTSGRPAQRCRSRSRAADGDGDLRRRRAGERGAPPPLRGRGAATAAAPPPAARRCRRHRARCSTLPRLGERAPRRPAPRTRAARAAARRGTGLPQGRHSAQWRRARPLIRTLRSEALRRLVADIGARRVAGDRDVDETGSRAQEQRLDGRHGDRQRGRELLVAEPLQLAHQQGRALLARQRHQTSASSRVSAAPRSTTAGGSPLARGGREGCVRLGVAVELRSAADAGRRSSVDAAVVGDAVEARRAGSPAGRSRAAPGRRAGRRPAGRLRGRSRRRAASGGHRSTDAGGSDHGSPGRRRRSRRGTARPADRPSAGAARPADPAERGRG